MSKNGASSPEHFEGVENLMAACDRVHDGQQQIFEAGYCNGPTSRSFLRWCASRIAVLETLSDQGVAYVSARDRYRLNEAAEEVKNFTQ